MRSPSDPCWLAPHFAQTLDELRQARATLAAKSDVADPAIRRGWCAVTSTFFLPRRLQFDEQNAPVQLETIDEITNELLGYIDALLARQISDGKLMLIDGRLRAEATPDDLVRVLVLTSTWRKPTSCS